MKYTYTHPHTHTDKSSSNALNTLNSLIIAFGVFASTCAFAQNNVQGEAEKVLAGLQAKYPDFFIRNVKKTELPNLYEVTIRDDIGYVFVDEKHTANPYRHFFLGGHLVDLERRVNLTAQAREAAQRIDVKTLPLKNAITEKRGTGEHVLYVFSDVDCGHCRRLHETLSQLSNVTIHTFLIPMAARYDTKRLEKSALVWCDAQPVKALNAVMTGTEPTGIAGCETPLLANLKLADTLYVKGTPTVFFADGSRVVGNQLKREGFEERFEAIGQTKKNAQKGQ